MQIEDIARIGLTSRCTTEEQGERTVGDGMLTEVIVDDQNILSLVHEVLSEGGRGIRCDVLDRCRISRGGRHDAGVLHRIVLLQVLDQRSDGRLLLTDGDIDTDTVLVGLVQDRIHRDGGLTGLTVADDQLTLSTTDREHRVDREDTGLQRFIDRLTVDDARCRLLDGTVLVLMDRAEAVDRLTEGVHDTTEVVVGYRHTGHTTGTHTTAALAEPCLVTEEDDTDAVPLDVLYHALRAIIELDDLTIHGMIEAVHDGDPITDALDEADFLLLGLQVEVGDALPEDGQDIRITREAGAGIPDLLEELIPATARRPVVLIIAHLEDEAATERLILLHLEIEVLCLILVKYKFLNIQELLLRRLRHIAKPNLDLTLGCRTDLVVLLRDLLPHVEVILLAEKLQGIPHLGRKDAVDDFISLLQ